MARRSTYYMGVDIHSGSPLSSQKPLYAVVIINEEGKIIVSQSGVPLSRVIRLAWDYRPAKIALDNVFELAASVKSLERILDLFPPESIIVQVTIEDGQPHTIREVARRHGLSIGRGKLDPVRTAYVAAYLAVQGLGEPVRVVEEKTVIVVTKSRSPRGGGYSQQRLQRRVRASVHIAAMRVKEALDRAGLEYDMNYRKSIGGLESAVFTVYAPREKLYGIVRPHRGVDYQVIVKPVYRTRISLGRARARPETPIIVGIDPGVTTGVAILDLRGRVVHITSGKGLDRGSLLELIARYGKPIMIAVDVSVIPESVRWVAAKFGAPIYSPPADLEASEKRELALRALSEPPQDTHQRDALAAAYKAFLTMKQKLEHVESQVKRMGLDLDVERVKESGIRGATIAQAIETAIEAKLAEERGRLETRRREEKKAAPRLPPDLDALKSRIEQLVAENKVLQKRVRELEKELELARLDAERARREARAELLRDAEVKALRDRLSLLQREIESLRDQLSTVNEVLKTLTDVTLSVARGDLVLVRRVKSLTPRSLRKSEEVYGALLPGEVVYVESPGVVDSEAARILAEAGVAGVLAPSRSRALQGVEDFLVPVVSLEDVGGLVAVAGLYFVSSEVLEVLAERRRKLEEAARSSLDLERLVMEYRLSRMKRKGAGQQGQRQG